MDVRGGTVFDVCQQMFRHIKVLGNRGMIHLWRQFPKFFHPVFTANLMKLCISEQASRNKEIKCHPLEA